MTNVFPATNPAVIIPSVPIQAASPSPIATSAPFFDTALAATQTIAAPALVIEEYIETAPPVVIGYLENSTVKFRCLNSPDCFRDIDLSRLWDAAWDASGQELSLLSVHYVNSAGIYVILGYQQNHVTQPQILVLRLNTKTDEVHYKSLPVGLVHTTAYLWVRDKLVVVAHLVRKTLTTIDIKDVLYLVQPDLSTTEVDITAIQPAILPQLIAGATDDVILLTTHSNLKAYRVIIASGEYTEIDVKHQFAAAGDWVAAAVAGQASPYRVYNVSSDLSQIYYLYRDPKIKADGHILGRFDAEAQAELTLLNGRCINWPQGYRQYQDMLYSSSECYGIECYGATTLIRMVDLEPVICGAKDLGYEPPRARVVPFGDYFLLDEQGQRIIVINFEGVKLGQFPLPTTEIPQSYQAMEYRK